MKLLHWHTRRTTWQHSLAKQLRNMISVLACLRSLGACNQLTWQRCMIECSWHLNLLMMSCQSDDKLLHAWLSEEHCWDSRQDQPADKAALHDWVLLTSWWWAAKVMTNSYMHGLLKSIAETQDRINQLTGQRCMIGCSWHLDILMMSCQSDEKLLHAWLSEEHCWDSRQDQPADRAGLCDWVLSTSWHLDCELPKWW